MRAKHGIVFDLGKNHCSCGEWVMTDISCLYVIPYVNHKIIELEDPSSEYYSMYTFKKAYFEVVYPLSEADLDLQENVIVLPPKTQRECGQIKKQWIKGKKERINMVQLGKGLPYFNAQFADNMNIITGHANEMVLSKLLVAML
jgi:hypothetical protein